MSNASNIRRASSLPAATGRNASGVRFYAEEFYGATGTSYVPLGRTVVTLTLPEATDNVDQPFFIADRAYKVVSVKEVHGTAGGAGATVAVKKCTGTQAAASGTAIATAVFDLTATANTVVTGTLSATAADYTLAAGDRLAGDFSGTISPLAGLNITVVLRAI